MVGICSAAENCSAYKKGQCTGCDCACIIRGSDEAAWFEELGYEEFQEDYQDY